MIAAIHPGRIRRIVWDTSLWLVLFLAAWAPRALALSAFVTVDERKWLNRAGNFFVALTNADWASTFQKEHPGVTIQWLGLLGYLTRFPGYARWAGGAITDDVLEQRLWADGRITPLELLVAGRWWVVLAVALAIVALYRPLQRLIGRPAALVAVLFVAWSPYFVALSRQLHPDGLLAALSLLALILWLAWLYGGRRPRDLIGSGLVLGLALLTKTTALFVGVTGALLLLVELILLWRQDRGGKLRLVGGGLIWGALAAATFVLLWPALWVDPLAVLLRISVQMQEYQAEVHSLPTYFMGRVIHDDPGWLFYPAVILWRMSPLTMLGLLPAVWFALRRSAPLESLPARRAAWGLLLFALLTVLGMSTGAKKIDRYVLPALPALDLLAALGWTALVTVWLPALDIKNAWPHLRSRGALITLAVLAMSHGLITLRYHPYYLTYFNPLLGGSRVAPGVMMIGWGEGLDQVGRWLSTRDHTAPLRVVSWYDKGPLSYYLPGDAHHQDFIDSDFYWFDADYAVLYANQWQRENPDPEMIAHFLAQQPLFAVTANGLELAKVYGLRQQTPPAFTHLFVESAGPLGESLTLAAYRRESSSVLPGETPAMTLFLKTDTALARDVQVSLALVDPAGQTVWREIRRPAGIHTRDWEPNVVYADPYTLAIPAGAEPGLYGLQLMLVDDQGAPLLAAPYPVTTLAVQAPDSIELDVIWDTVRLTRIGHAPRVAAGQSLLVDLTAAGKMTGATKLSLRLVDAQGKTWAQQDKEFEPTLRFVLDLPPDAPEGLYTVMAVAYEAATLTAQPDQTGASPTQLSTVGVLAR